MLQWINLICATNPRRWCQNRKFIWWYKIQKYLFRFILFRIFIYFKYFISDNIHFCLFFCILHLLKHTFLAGTRRLCNTRLTLDLTSYRRCILVEIENRVDVNIWRWLNIGFWLHNLKTTKHQCQLTSVLDINLTLTLDVEFTLNFLTRRRNRNLT